MKYFRLRNFMNTKMMGHYPAIKRYIHHTHVDDTRFIGNTNYKRIDFVPITLDIEYFAKSEITDLIERGGTISSYLPISSKLMKILKKYRSNGIQFFNINIIRNKQIYNNYYLLNMYEFNQEFIDFSKSDIYYNKYKSENSQIINVSNLNDFDEMIITKGVFDEIFINHLYLKDVNQDFFILKYVEGGVGYYVSERLKQEIERAECTGIEFQPSELNYNEWTAPDGEREKVYGKI